MKILFSRWIYEGFYSLKQDMIECEKGTQLPFTSLIVKNDAVVVLAQDTKNQWLLVREYRHPTGKHLLGCAGGTMDEDESPIEAGKRELLEETGYTSDDLQLLGASYPFPGICNQKIYFVLAKNCIDTGKRNLDPLEQMEVELWEDAALKKELRESEEINGLVCAALYYLNLQE